MAMRTRISHLIAALTAAATFTACGGGGGDVVNPPVQVTGSFVVTLSTPTLTLAPGATQTIVRRWSFARRDWRRESVPTRS